MNLEEYYEFKESEAKKRQEDIEDKLRNSRYGEPKKMIDVETGDIILFSGWTERYERYSKETVIGNIKDFK